VLDLLKVEASVTLINAIKGWQADTSLQKRVKQKGTVTLLDNHEIIRVEGTDQVTGVVVKNRDSRKEEKLRADGLFVEIGLLPNSEPVKDLVEHNEYGEVVDCLSQTSVEGLYGAGDVTTVPHKQIVIAAGEGAKAALSAYDCLMRKSLI
jgi:alkyl hydroperoxide reductase subunit F